VRNVKANVRQWTKKLLLDPDLNLEFNGPVQHRRRNVTQLMDVNRSMMPVDLDMPIDKAELNFHEYVLADVSS